MSRRWRLRLGAGAAAWAATVAVFSLLQMRPAVVPLAAITAAVAVVLWVLLDLGDVAQPVDWRATSDVGSGARGTDVRLAVLSRQVSDARALDGGRSLQRALVALVDDALRTRHGIDRATDPDGAAAALGPELASFTSVASLDTPPGASPVTELTADPARLAQLLDRIEYLCLAPPDPPAESELR
jgi:hypothetical protein